MAIQQPERHLAAILAADVAGYSRLMSTNEEGTLAQLKEHRRELGDPKIKEYRGHIIKTTGDGMLVEFVSAVDALRCAIEIQRGMFERNAGVPPEDRIEFRIGINVGDIIADEGAAVPESGSTIGKNRTSAKTAATSLFDPIADVTPPAPAIRME